MMKNVDNVENVHIACGYTDLKKDMDGLSLMVQQSLSVKQLVSNTFLFCGKKRSDKAPYWEGDGFVLLVGTRLFSVEEYCGAGTRVEHIAISLAHGGEACYREGKNIPALRQVKTRIM